MTRTFTLAHTAYEKYLWQWQMPCAWKVITGFEDSIGRDPVSFFLVSRPAPTAVTDWHII